jgi:Fe-S-cluster containining protein
MSRPRGAVLSLHQRYSAISNEVEEEFARNRRLHGGRIQCRPGCTDCCHQLFQITEIEAASISRAVTTLPGDLQARLRERAREYLTRRTQLVAATGEPEAWGSLPPPGTRLLCPALEDGACQIYASRPLICRKFGMPLFNPDRPGRVFACELNFREGDEIEDAQLIQIQTGIHQRWKQLQGAYNAMGLPRETEPISVARAIVEDFSALVSE